MDAREQLTNEKAALLKQIAEFAQKGNSQEVLIITERLKRVEFLLDKYERLIQEITDFKNVHGEIDKAEDIKGFEEQTGRGYGKIIRMEVLRKLSKQGIQLENFKGSIYKTKSGYKVGIAVATEKNGRWFLGLPVHGFDHAVMLCKCDNDVVVEIYLPKEFFDEYRDKMSQSAGQMKFNIVRRGNGYTILVPGTNGVNVTNYVGDYSILK
jgi:hypothetical protein